MTSAELETNYLSMRFWLLKCVLPAALVLTFLLIILPLFISHPQYKDQTALVFGFFMLYFVLVRGGHLVMIRSMHFELKRTYGEVYDTRLAKLPHDLHRRNLGFSLARIKRDLIDHKLDRSRRR